MAKPYSVDLKVKFPAKYSTENEFSYSCKKRVHATIHTPLPKKYQHQASRLSEQALSDYINLLLLVIFCAQLARLLRLYHVVDIMFDSLSV